MSTTIPKLTLEDARALQSSFEGSITSSHDAQAEFRGKPTVLIPESIDDIERALRLAQAANRRVFVVSGHSVSAADVSKSVAAARKAAAAIVSMEAFRDVDVGDQRVTVGAAATTGDVAQKLVDKDLFLPLDDNPTQSIVSAVFSMNTSPFLRSGTGLSPLRSAVVEAERSYRSKAPERASPRRSTIKRFATSWPAGAARSSRSSSSTPQPRRRTNPTAGRRLG
jgi:hypothetical protein